MTETFRSTSFQTTETAPSQIILGRAARRDRTDRLKLWDLPNTLHCAVIGTCLSMAELRRITRKLGLFARVDRLSDHELHAAFVKHADTRNRASSTLQKLLETNYAGAIRRAGRCVGEEALAAFWDESVAEGQVSAAFWALLTHPQLTDELELRLFGEVHMMSHLCGASHRADARMLAAVERQRNALAEKLTLGNARHSESLAARDEEIGRLKRLVQALEPMVRELPELRERIQRHEQGDAMRRVQRDLQQATARHDAASGRIQRLVAENAWLSERVAQLEKELATRQATDAPGACDGAADCLGADACLAAERCLEGRCIAYVGGRPQTVSRIRDYVERCKGCLLHHDGGTEQSAFALDGILRRADLVLFPVDCVSHNAVEKLKAVCERENKSFHPLASSSFSAFANALSQRMTDLEDQGA